MYVNRCVSVSLLLSTKIIILAQEVKKRKTPNNTQTSSATEAADDCMPDVIPSQIGTLGVLK